jgi:hypothetical protein
VIAALRQALDELDIGNHHFISEHRARLAERLRRCVPATSSELSLAWAGARRWIQPSSWRAGTPAGPK